MSTNKLPAIQFYPCDWRSDPGIQALSYEDRGIWFEILCLMHQSPQRGVLLLPSGAPMTPLEISKVLGISKKKVIDFIQRLCTAGVCDRNEKGALVNRRMVRDEALLNQRKEWGKLGAPHGIKGGRPPKNKTEVPVSEGVSTKPPNNPPSSSSSSSEDIYLHTSLFSSSHSRAEPAETTGSETEIGELKNRNQELENRLSEAQKQLQQTRAQLLANIETELQERRSGHYGNGRRRHESDEERVARILREKPGSAG